MPRTELSSAAREAQYPSFEVCPDLDLQDLNRLEDDKLYYAGMQIAQNILHEMSVLGKTSGRPPPTTLPQTTPPTPTTTTTTTIANPLLLQNLPLQNPLQIQLQNLLLAHCEGADIWRGSRRFSRRRSYWILAGSAESSRAKRDVCCGANPSYHRGCRDPVVSDGLLLGAVS